MKRRKSFTICISLMSVPYRKFPSPTSAPSPPSPPGSAPSCAAARSGVWGGEPKKPRCWTLGLRREDCDPCDPAGGDTCGPDGEPPATAPGRRAGVLSERLCGEPDGGDG